MERRDRRDVLKLIAGGAATAVGASVIQTSSAYADSGSGSCLPQNWPKGSDIASAVFLTELSGYPVILVDTTFSPLLAPISCSSAGKAIHVRWSMISSPAGARLLTHESAGQGGGAVTTDLWLPFPRTQVRVTDSTSTSNLGLNGTYAINVQVRVVCTGVKQCWRCFNANIAFEWQDGLGDTSITSSNGSANCNDFGV